MSISYANLWPTSLDNFIRNMVQWAKNPQAQTLALDTDANGTPSANTLYKGLIPKAWLHYDQTGTPTILDEVNISSVTDGGTGIFTPVIDLDFASADGWCAVGICTNDTGGTTNICTGYHAAPAAGSVALENRNSGGVLSDRADIAVICFGRQT